jgi:hypothetical protein
MEQVTMLHAEIMGFGHLTVVNAIRTGELLIEMKARRGHGEWMDFAESHSPFETRTVA